MNGISMDYVHNLLRLMLEQIGCAFRTRAHSLQLAPLLALVVLTGCRARIDSVQVILDRHTKAIAKLPEEERSMLMPYGSPVAGEQAKNLLPVGVLDLEEARAIAVRANPDVHAAQARLASALARIAEARSRYFPTVTFTHTSTRTFQTPASRNRLGTVLQPTQQVPSDVESPTFALTTLLNAIRRPLFGAEGPKGDRNSFSEHSAAFTVAWTLFDGFVREARLLGAKHLYHATGASLADIERLIVQAVDTSYYQVQLAEEQLRIARADEAFSQEQLEETEKLRAAGRATRADVDNFRVRVLVAQADVTAALGLQQTGRVLLTELMGLSGTLPPDLRLSHLADETEEEMAVPDPPPWIERALENRPDVIRLEHVLKNAKEELRATEGLFMPTIAISGSWGFDRSSTLRYTREDQSSAAALEFRWDLFTGGARRARVRAGQSAVTEAEARLKRLRLAVESQVRQAIIDLNDAQQHISLRRESLETARENRRIIQASYVAGKETLTRLNEAQRDYIAADADLALARIRLRQAWSDLHAAAANYRDTVVETARGNPSPAKDPNQADSG